MGFTADTVNINVDIVLMESPAIKQMGRVRKDASLIFIIHFVKVTFFILRNVKWTSAEIQISQAMLLNGFTCVQFKGKKQESFQNS